MKTMKVIDLLNKIANGEEVPKKIKYKDEVREYVYKYRDYVNQYSDRYFLFFSIMKKGKGSDFENALNDEVEIIEDTPKKNKKIEDRARFQYSQIPSWFDIKELIKAVNENFEVHQQALNEIIDKVNGE